MGKRNKWTFDVTVSFQRNTRHTPLASVFSFGLPKIIYWEKEGREELQKGRNRVSQGISGPLETPTRSGKRRTVITPSTTIHPLARLDAICACIWEYWKFDDFNVMINIIRIGKVKYIWHIVHHLDPGWRLERVISSGCLEFPLCLAWNGRQSDPTLVPNPLCSHVLQTKVQ